MHKELSKQANIIDKADKCETERKSLTANNIELKTKCRKLELDFKQKEKELKNKYEDELEY